MPTQSNITVGRPETSPSLPSHVRGVHEGNQPGSQDREAVKRSTGINPRARRPIDPKSPLLSPA